jgi:hypothetical protein
MMIAWAVALASLGGIEFPGEEAPADSVTMHGRVTDISTGFPVAFAAVRFPQVGRTALTDAEGRFVLRDLPAGPLLIEISSLGYEPRDLVVLARAGEGVEIELQPEPVVLEGIVATIDRLGQRTSRIPYSVYAWGEADLAAFGRPSVNEFLSEQPWLMCIDDSCNTLVQARARAPFLFIDEIHRPWVYLKTYDTAELYRIEFIRNCPMVRVYTRAYMERVARGRVRLADSFVADCVDIRRRMGLRLF